MKIPSEPTRGCDPFHVEVSEKNLRALARMATDLKVPLWVRRLAHSKAVKMQASITAQAARDARKQEAGQ